MTPGAHGGSGAMETVHMWGAMFDLSPAEAAVAASAERPVSIGGEAHVFCTLCQLDYSDSVAASPCGRVPFQVSLPRTADGLPGRNDRCWCNSGRKYKKCHGRTS
jgi:hypothetical protein